MKFTARIGLIALLIVLLSGVPVPAAHGSRAAAQRGQANRKEDSIITAIAEAVPLGKEAIRAIVKPLLDTVTITPQQETRIGNDFYKQISKKLGSKLDANRTDVAYVNAIGQKLATNVTRKGIRYRFHIVEEGVPNAFAIAGGHVFIYRGLLDKVIRNEAQLASVLGHEISHVDAGHTVDFYKPIVAAAQLPLADVATMVAALASQLLTFSYNEVQENEADRLGTRLAFKANYDTLEGAAVQRRLQKLQPTGARDSLTGLADSVLRTHPPSEARAQAIEAETRRLRRLDPNRKAFTGAGNYAQRVPVAVRALE